MCTCNLFSSLASNSSMILSFLSSFRYLRNCFYSFASDLIANRRSIGMRGNKVIVIIGEYWINSPEVCSIKTAFMELIAPIPPNTILYAFVRENIVLPPPKYRRIFEDSIIWTGSMNSGTKGIVKIQTKLRKLVRRSYVGLIRDSGSLVIFLVV